MTKPKDKPEDFAKTFTGMLTHTRAVRLGAAEAAYIAATVGTPMNRKQRRQNMKGKKK